MVRFNGAVLITLAALGVMAGPASWAQHAGHSATMPGPAAGPAAGRASPAAPEPGGVAPPGSAMASMDKMSKDMAAVPMTGDADRDFVAMMIPHHQGAIDMARQQLAHGKDPALRKLARDVIAAQDREIAEMRKWQARHPPR